jgi:hypothetical protein
MASKQFLWENKHFPFSIAYLESYFSLLCLFLVPFHNIVLFGNTKYQEYISVLKWKLPWKIDIILCPMVTESDLKDTYKFRRGLIWNNSRLSIGAFGFFC